MRAELFHGAFRWIADRAELFRLRHRTVGDHLTGVKRLAELATLAGATITIERDAAALLALAWTEVGHGAAIIEALSLHPGIAIAYLPFVRAGLRCGELETTLAGAAFHEHHRRWDALTRYAVGVMLETIGVAPAWSPAESLRSLRLLQPENPWPFPTQVAVLAHAVMWHSGMGVAPTALTLGAGRCFRALGDRLIDGAHFDPLAELLVANDCIDGEPLVDAWRALVAAQRVDGSVPPSSTASSSRFDCLYHPTLVAALAAARTN